MEGFIFMLFVGLFVFVLIGFRVIRPVEKAIIERFGKYARTTEQGLRWVIPFVDRVYKVNITEIRLDIPKQLVITKDNLNLEIDAVVYFKVKDVLKSIYNVNSYITSIPSLAQTTLRSIIGELNFTEVNAKRQIINQKIEVELDSQTEAWGIDILRVELQDVQPSAEVQNAMDKVVTAEREKEAKITRAIAEKEASKQIAEATVIQAEADKTAEIIRANGESQAIEMVNTAVEKTFKENARKFKALEVTERSLMNNSKIVITESGINPSIIFNDSKETVVPAPHKKKANNIHI